ncbi:cation diffusion facilitator family transporter [Robbsia sp. Bb-Pol-6]|uniref:Cation diffusion facilitator family transporter n=1 Tax=Robbsia betulipollinis TaxID=2981849 RepID=A0ABT3ZP36_9BURK|nr:cation diffusion facilitator family transporter [Robbsia betulipollinis]MCY0388037.1 cation diffusion facilitator family transporter [Robbsia betulipollinis]
MTQQHPSGASAPASSTHDHGHAGHDHGHHHGGAGHMHVHGSTNETRLAWALLVIVLFMGIEIVGGLLSGSLALIADAAHMASDAVALGMSWAALRIGRRPATARLSYGYRRLEVLVAFINGLTLLLVSLGVMIEAVRRFAEPQPVLGPMMMAVAVAGLLSNVVTFLILNGGSRENLNMRSAWLHVLGDMVSSVAAIIAAGVILLTGFSPIDPILSIFVSVLIVRGAWQIVRSAGRILLEATPSDLDLEEVRADLIAQIGEISDVHHLHAWSLTSEQAMVTLHARATPGADPLRIPAAVCARLKERFSIDHATVQVEAEHCTDADGAGQAHEQEHGHAHGHDGHDHGAHDHDGHDHGPTREESATGAPKPPAAQCY